MGTIHNFDSPAATALLDTDTIPMLSGTTSRAAVITGSQLRSHMSGIVVATTAGATTLTVTAALHAGRTVTLNNTAPIAVTMPAATGTGHKYRFWVGVVATATATTIAALTTDIIAGYALAVTTTSDNAEGFKTSATSDKISLNGTTLGGVVGDIYELTDVKAATWSVMCYTAPTGTEATPFSAT